MMFAEYPARDPGRRLPPDQDLDNLAQRVRQLEDRVRWIEAQVEVDRARRREGWGDDG